MTASLLDCRGTEFPVDATRSVFFFPNAVKCDYFHVCTRFGACSVTGHQASSPSGNSIFRIFCFWLYGNAVRGSETCKNGVTTTVGRRGEHADMLFNTGEREKGGKRDDAARGCLTRKNKFEKYRNCLVPAIYMLIFSGSSV